MSFGAIKEDCQTLRIVGELIRNGETDKACDVMAQALGPNSVVFLRKALAHGITVEKLAEFLIKAPQIIERVEQHLKQRGASKREAQKQQEQIEAQKAAELAAAKEAAESQRRFEERMKYYEEQRKKLHNKDKKLTDEEKKLIEKIEKEKKAENRRKFEQKLREVREKRRKLYEEKKKLEAMRQKEEAAHKSSTPPKCEVKQTTLNPQLNNTNSR